MRFFGAWLNNDPSDEARFELNLKSFFGDSTRFIPLGRARAGIYLLVKSTIAGDKKRVIMSPYTIPDVINMVKFAGGEPVFVDFLPNSTNVDIEHLKSLLDERTACVLLIHYHVPQKDIIDIVELCRARNIGIFDDCAIALGARVNGVPIGVVTDGSMFSLSGFKIINFYWGGVITVGSNALFKTINDQVSRWARLQIAHYKPQIKKTGRYAVATSSALFGPYFKFRRKKITSGKIVEIFSRSSIETVTLDETITSRPSLSAFAEWNRKFSTIADIIDHHRRIAAIYDKYFRKIAVSAETSDAQWKESPFFNYPIVVGQERRNEIYHEILSAGYDVGLSLYPNVHELETFTEIAGRTENVSNLVRSIISLPTHIRISESYARRLAICVQGVLKPLAAGDSPGDFDVP